MNNICYRHLPGLQQSLAGLRFWNLWLPATFALTLSACGDIYLDAPRGANIQLMPTDAPAQVHVEQTVWFKYWGNQPFSEPETHAATIIRERNLYQARTRMVNTFADGIISAITGPFGFPRRTLIVEGNLAPAETSAPVSEMQSDKPL